MLLPYPILTACLRKRQLWRLFLQYQRALEKYRLTMLRKEFLTDCLKNDLIPKFLSFRVPENGCFEPTAVHNFQKRLLRDSIRKATESLGNHLSNTETTRRALAAAMPHHLLLSLIWHSRRKIRELLATRSRKLENKVQLLSQRQDKPLAQRANNVKVMTDEEIPQYVLDVLSLGPKHPQLDEFKEMSFLSDLDSLLADLKRNNESNELLNDINSIGHWYVKKMRRQKIDRAANKARKFLKERNLLAVPFDKGCGFCVMRRELYAEKIAAIVSGPEFEELKTTDTGRSEILKNEDRYNRRLLALRNKGWLSEALYSDLRSTGSLPPRLYGLAKVHKADTPLRPVLSLPGSCYAKLDQFLARFFENVPGANIETSTLDVREALEQVKLDDDEEIFSLDVKSLYTKVPVKEAIDLAVDKLYATDKPPKMTKSAFSSLMELAVVNVRFMANNSWYVQRDGVAMGSALSVILANLWMKKFEPVLSGQAIHLEDEEKPPCGRCQETVTRRGYSIRCPVCMKWFHRACADLSVEEIKCEQVTSTWKCGCVKVDLDGAKLFRRYVDDMILSGKKSEINSSLERFNRLHPNLQLTIERLDGMKIPFLDMLITQNANGTLATTWYTKPTDTGVILSYRAEAPLKYKRNVIQGTIHRIFRATTSWEEFHKSLEKAKEIWYKNRYPTTFCEKIVFETVNSLVEPEKREREEDEGYKFVTQYRGRISDQLKSRLRSAGNIKTIFTTRKLKTLLPPLKDAIPKDYCSGVVYEIKCTGCSSSYVGQTTRHLTTRYSEHLRVNSPLSEHLKECAVDAELTDARILDKCNVPFKLPTLEALYIAKMRPSLNQQDGWSRELTIKL